MMKRIGTFVLSLALLSLCPFPAPAEEETLSPAWPVPVYVERLLQVASEEVGYTEDHGRTKYGAWAGDPAAQWCAEFLCWCVDQVDQRWRSALLREVFPYYTASNTGRSWFIRAGRYVVRAGKLEGWGKQWLTGSRTYLQPGEYIPQPGDWAFFNWTGGSDTQHVALVEYCARDTVTGNILVHVIEGNNPSAVARNSYELNSPTILGYGTVRDVAEMTMSFGNRGNKVLLLQEKLAYLGYLDTSLVTGRFGDGTSEAVRSFQLAHGLPANAVADLETQTLLTREYDRKYESDPEIWTVADED